MDFPSRADNVRARDMALLDFEDLMTRLVVYRNPDRWNLEHWGTSEDGTYSYQKPVPIADVDHVQADDEQYAFSNGLAKPVLTTTCLVILVFFFGSPPSRQLFRAILFCSLLILKTCNNLTNFLCSVAP